MGNRLIVAVLAAVDALVAAVAGLGAVLAPLTLVWVFGFGDHAAWGALWPTGARVWQLGHLVPLSVTLPADYAVTAGVAADASSFTLSLAPLALAVFTAIAAARSGARAAAAGAPATGAVVGTVVFAALAAVIAFTSRNPVAEITTWQAVLLPALVFGVPAVLSALAGAWRLGGHRPLDALRDHLGPRWAPVPGAVVRGAAIVAAGLVAVGALAVATLVVLRGGQVIALFEAGRVDALGATAVTLGQLGYLPTLVAWAIAYVAGPGVALGATATVAPAVAQTGVVPGIPVLGIIPAESSPWLLLLALVPVGLAVAAGLRARRDLGPSVPPRLVTALVLGLLVAGAGWVVATAASGSIGPAGLAMIGPDALAVAIALGAETLVGAAIALLAPAGEDAGPEPATERPRELVGAAGPYEGRL